MKIQFATSDIDSLTLFLNSININRILIIFLLNIFQEPNNLMNVSTFRYSGLVHPHTIGINPSVDKKGVIFAYKKHKKLVSVLNFIF